MLPKEELLTSDPLEATPETTPKTTRGPSPKALGPSLLGPRAQGQSPWVQGLPEKVLKPQEKVLGSSRASLDVLLELLLEPLGMKNLRGRNRSGKHAPPSTILRGLKSLKLHRCYLCRSPPPCRNVSELVAGMKLGHAQILPLQEAPLAEMFRNWLLA